MYFLLLFFMSNHDFFLLLFDFILLSDIFPEKDTVMIDAFLTCQC